MALFACAQNTPRARFEPVAVDDAPPVWPGLPEIPRYRYAGDLVGETNYVTPGRANGGSAANMLRWLAGIDAAPVAQKLDLLRPQSGAVDAAGRILVTDSGLGAVFVFDPAASDVALWQDADAGDRFATPVGIVVLASQDVLVADASLGRVVRLDRAGRPTGSFGLGELDRPTGLASDRAGRVYVADSRQHDIKVFDRSGQLLARLGRRGKAAGEFNGPTHLALRGDRLYVADTLNARVQTLSLDGQPLRSDGQRGLFVGNFIRPKGITLDAAGNLYVVESYFDHLLVFREDGRFLLPIGGSGAAPGRFSLPAGVWSDEKDRIFVADMYNARVAIFQRLTDAP